MTKNKTPMVALAGASPPVEDEIVSALLPSSRHHIDRRAGDVIAQSAGEPDDLLTTTEVAEWLGISTQWLEIGRSRAYGPKFVRLTPRRVRYLRSSVIEWLRERQFHATAEYS
jgi:predicted DNA-binding transcriptional regulator AlpA